MPDPEWFALRMAERVVVDGRLVHPREGIAHGDVSTYTNYGCRCEECTAANSAKVQQRRERRWAQRELIDGRWVYPSPPSGHGRTSTYTNYGCRCPACAANYATLDRTRKQARKVRAGGGS